ncbi:DUF6843 domain-containing protein [Metabacillus litoralis]|uniref:DUF6843 domain-containing protein n=1 Tax=Metabacillus litoralis TaxID=152268 RepID=UPI001CFD4F40|nr:hypothetical protein [Metabacillus litoralis]
MKKLLVVFLSLFFLFGCKQDDQVSPRTFLIPDGYTGWVKVKYNAEVGQTLKTSTSSKLQEYRVSSTGVVKTPEQHIHEGWATNKYFYINKDGQRKKLIPGKMVHGSSSGRELSGGTTEYFFVGTSKQFHKDHYLPNEFDTR